MITKSNYVTGLQKRGHRLEEQDAQVRPKPPMRKMEEILRSDRAEGGGQR